MNSAFKPVQPPRKALIMLVLTRKVNAGDQSVITIGTDVEVTLIEIKGDQVRLGITAPTSVTIHRKEVWEQVQQQNQAAAASGPASTVGLTLDEIRRRGKTP